MRDLECRGHIAALFPARAADHEALMTSAMQVAELPRAEIAARCGVHFDTDSRALPDLIVFHSSQPGSATRSQASQRSNPSPRTAQPS